MNKNLNYVVIEYPDFAFIKSFEHDCTAYHFFKRVSEIIAFDDCTDAKVTDIIWHGKHVKYDG